MANYELYDGQGNLIHQEEIPDPPLSLTEQLKAIYEAQDIETQLAFYGLVPQVLAAISNNRADLAKLIIERADIPEELDAVQAALLAVFPA